MVGNFVIRLEDKRHRFVGVPNQVWKPLVTVQPEVKVELVRWDITKIPCANNSLTT